MKTTSKRDLYKTYDAFPGDELTIEDINAFQKKKCAKWDTISRQEIDDMKRGLSNAIAKPINLTPVEKILGKGSEKKKVKFSDSVNETLLFTQFEAMRGKGKGFVTHNFDSSSSHFTQLYMWNIFNTVTEGIMRPIYYLRTQQGKGSTPSSSSSNRLTIQKQIASGTIECLDLVNGIEDMMGCMMVRLIINHQRLVFLFEWYEEPLFLFMIAFDTPTCDKALDGMTLHRSDLFVARQVDAVDAEEDDRERRIMMGNVPEDQREGMEEIPYQKAESTFISFYGQKVDIEAIETLKSGVPLAYISYGYILNEENKDCAVLFT